MRHKFYSPSKYSIGSYFLFVSLTIAVGLDCAFQVIATIEMNTQLK